MSELINDGNIRISRLRLGQWETNAYIVTCLATKESAIVDAPADANAIIDGLQGSRAKFILLTHNHMDHIGALGELRARLNIPLWAHSADATGLMPHPEKLLWDGEILTMGEFRIEVIHTPGHTPGSLCFKVGKHLISGDTLFPGGPGHTRTPAALKQVIKYITEKIFILPDDTPVYPGHGETTVLKKEKAEFAVFAGKQHAPGLCGDVVWLTS